MNPILMDIPEVIETSNLILRMPREGYGVKLHDAILDGYDDYVKWLAWKETPPTIDEVEEDCRKHHAEFILREFIRYLIFEKESGAIIGRCAFPSFQSNWSIPQFGISYFIRASKRGLGHATQAAHAMTCLAFQLLKARKVEIYCDAENLASCRVPERLNFQLEYTQRGGWPRKDGALAELRTYAMFSESDLPKDLSIVL